MINNISSDKDHQQIHSHMDSYRGFLRLSIAAIFSCSFTLVALVAFAFVHHMSLFLGFTILVIGHSVIVIDLVMISRKTASRGWWLSLATWLFFAFIVAMMLS